MLKIIENVGYITQLIHENEQIQEIIDTRFVDNEQV